VRARRDGTLNWTVGPRTLTLLKVATADLLEVSATSDASSTSTSYALLTGMQHVDPGVNEWLALFTASQFLDASSASNDNISYSVFRSAGPTQETDSERTTTHEGSVDGADLYCNSHGTVTPASGTDDVEIHWKSDTSVSRTCHERTLVLVREAQGGGSPLVVRRPRGVVAPWF